MTFVLVKVAKNSNSVVANNQSSTNKTADSE